MDYFSDFDSDDSLKDQDYIPSNAEIIDQVRIILIMFVFFFFIYLVLLQKYGIIFLYKTRHYFFKILCNSDFKSIFFVLCEHYFDLLKFLVIFVVFKHKFKLKKKKKKGYLSYYYAKY